MKEYTDVPVIYGEKKVIYKNAQRVDVVIYDPELVTTTGDGEDLMVAANVGVIAMPREKMTTEWIKHTMERAETRNISVLVLAKEMKLGDLLGKPFKAVL